MIKAIIFDMDDVIVNSAHMHFDAYERSLKHFGLRSCKLPEDLKTSIYGMRIKEIMELLVDHFKMDVDVIELTKWRNKYFLEIVKEGMKPMPGLEVLVKNIEDWGLKRALATSGVREYVNEILNQFGLTNFFGHIVTGDDVKNPKPAPDVFLKAAEGIGIEPSNCAVIEDADKGIQAAKAAGMLAIGLQTGSGQSLKQADIVIDRLDQITLEMIGNKV